MHRSFLSSARMLLAVAALSSADSPVLAEPSVGVSHRVLIVGAERTRPNSLLELLPRPPPTQYSDAELRELERRIANLEIFGT